MFNVEPRPSLRATPSAVPACLPRITALGGGTGLAVLLRGLRELYRQAEDTAGPTAIVTVADDGGSSGRLRREFDMLAPGDIRNCLLALSDADPTLQQLFDFRFDGKLGDHSLGNLMLVALTLMERDFGKAVQRAAGLLAVHGRVLPATLDEVALLARFEDGSCSMGESCITAAGRRIERLSLVPPDTRPAPEALKAIAGSDLVVIGPGSLYTSLIPVLLVVGLVEAIAASHAQVALVMNLMSEPGETDDYDASDLVAALRRHAPALPLHHVLLNRTPLAGEQLRRYGAEGAAPIPADHASLASLGLQVSAHDLLGEGPKARHDPRKLAQALLELAA